jgi:CBS domain-containing protein
VRNGWSEANSLGADRMGLGEGVSRSFWVLQASPAEIRPMDRGHRTLASFGVPPDLSTRHADSAYLGRCHVKASELQCFTPLRHERPAFGLLLALSRTPMRVGDIMTRSPAVCPDDAVLADAARMMWERDIGFLPVVDRRGVLVGTMTDRELVVAAYTLGKPLWAIPVPLAMAVDVSPSREQDDLGLVHDLLRRFHVKCVPVVDAARLVVGVVSLSDLARQVDDPSAAEVGTTVIATLVQVARPQPRLIRSEPPPLVGRPRGKR